VNSSKFHARRFKPARRAVTHTQRMYAGEGDKVFAFVVTSDGEVYKQNTAWFGMGSKEYFFEFDAKSGSEGSALNVDVKGDAARVVEGKVVGSWDDYNQAKNYAINLVKSKAAATPAGMPTPPDTSDPNKKPDEKPGMSKGLIVGLTAGGVLLFGGLLWAASRPAAR